MQNEATAGWRTASCILSQKLTQERAAELCQLQNPRGSQEIFDRGRQTAGKLLCCLMGCWCAVAQRLLFLRSQYVHKHKYQKVTKVYKLYGSAYSVYSISILFVWQLPGSNASSNAVISICPDLNVAVCVVNDCPQWFRSVLQLLVHMKDERKCAELVNKYMQSTWA